jgi:hypothetical protein
MLPAMHRATADHWAVSALTASGALTAKFGRPAFSLALMRKHLAEGFGFAFAKPSSRCAGCA